MRDWHHRIIKLNEALALINASNRTVIAVCESDIEFENLSSTPLLGLNYKAKNRGLFKIIGSVQKSSLIGWNGSNVTPNIAIGNSSSHTTSVAGIILANEKDSSNTVLPVRGVIEDAELINFGTNFLNLIFSTLDNFSYYNNDGGKIIDSSFNLFPANFTFNSDSYIPPNKQALIINASYTLKFYNNSDIATFNVIFKTCKAYSNKGRGVLFVVAAGNSNNDTINTQHYGKLSYPLIVSAVTIDDKKVFDEVSEMKSPYSCFGDRVDICAPSNGRKNGIYSTTNLKCGEIGYDDEVIIKTITSQTNNGRFTLDNTHQIFPGNCLEVGIPNTINHEVLIVDNVDRSTNKVEFISNRYYTATPFVINPPAIVRIPILKTPAVIISNNKFSITDKRGFGYVGQEICIYNGTAYHYANITLVNSPTEFEFNPALPSVYNTAGVEVVPGQIVISSNSYNISDENTVFTFSPSDDYILKSFFVGGMVAVYGDGTYLDMVANIDKINTIGSRTITLGKFHLTAGYTTVKLVSVGYGSYTSSFGGTSAAAPVVSGVAGLIHKANPQLNSLEIKHILKSTVDKINLKENNSTGKWKDSNGNNISYSSASTLSQPTVIGNNEIFVSSIASYNVNDAVQIDGDFKSVIEKIIAPNRLVLQLAVTSVYSSGSSVKKGNFPERSKFYGTGRVNAKRAVQLALDWHNTVNPTQTVFKPKLALADRMQADGSVLFGIDPIDTDQTVNSPDIWVKPFTDASTTVPTSSLPLNTMDTSVDQKIYVRVRNQGNTDSFKDCDLRVYIAFTDDVNPAFPFPSKWFDQADVKLLSVTELPTISAASELILPAIEWKNIVPFWNTNNPLDPVTTTRKRAYILVHIAPFDGTDLDVQIDNVRKNKQLTYKEIIVTHNGVNDRTAYLPGSKVDIEVTDQLIERSYDLIMENVDATIVNNLKVKATRKNRVDNSLETVIYSKSGATWSIENGSPDWISFVPPVEVAVSNLAYKNVKFPHTILVNQDEQEVKIEIVNA
ncbi:MAG: S8 family serine peptidase [Flavobacteriales bacterium]|nr:S8 family serine peptidase [Flavobacteriales bacterium]